jgi:hypothetical protein
MLKEIDVMFRLLLVGVAGLFEHILLQRLPVYAVYTWVAVATYIFSIAVQYGMLHKLVKEYRGSRETLLRTLRLTTAVCTLVAILATPDVMDPTVTAVHIMMWLSLFGGLATMYVSIFCALRSFRRHGAL